MTVIYMMYLVLFIISLVLVLDQLQGKNLKKQATCPRSQELKKMLKKRLKGRKCATFSLRTIT